jgi:sterol desaturase/sphingolipid hydroxylase (fatty acid hydroxylase superfamily)/creatinine amidohydrolase/Fe(II)-dependent formamide hydrolase-like protein
MEHTLSFLSADWLTAMFVGDLFSRTNVIYLLTAMIIAVVLGFPRRLRPGDGEFLFAKAVWWHPSARVDYAFMLINAGLKILIWGGAAVALVVGVDSAVGYLAAMNIFTPAPTPPPAAIVVLWGILVFVAMDFGVFLGHWLFHKHPLWLFHKVHHSAEVLTPFTLYRMHPVDEWITGSLAGILSAGMAIVACLVMGIEKAPALLFQPAGIILVIFYFTGYNLRHSHIWVAYPRWLSKILISPAMHQLHHSYLNRHIDKNFGLVFGLWDWMFGTLYIPEKKEKFPLGVKGIPPKGIRSHSTALHLLITPFIELWGCILSWSHYRRVVLYVPLLILVGVTSAGSAPLPNTIPPNLWLENMTSPEIRQALDAGYQAVIIPTAGIEQNGAHMPLDKHNHIIHHTSEQLARRLGCTLIAPVVDFVPEGDIAPPSGHMRYPGTISVREDTFERLLEDITRSLWAHGFRLVYFIGDSGGNQQSQDRVARKLSSAAPKGYTVAHIAGYYAVPEAESLLRAKGFSNADIGKHAGIRDTSDLMFTCPACVRQNLMRPSDGTDGDPGKASAELGAELIELRVGIALKAMQPLQKQWLGDCSRV